MLESVPGYILFMFTAVTLFEVGVVYFFYSRWQQAKQLQIASLGHEVSGQITDKNSVAGKHGDKFFASYTFEDWQGHAYNGRQSVPEHMWNIMKPDDEIRVVYVRSQPKINSLAKRVDKHVESKMFMFRIMLLMLFTLPVMFVAIAYPYMS